MVSSRLYSVRWFLLLAALVLGTFLGIFFQRFSATAPLFGDIATLKLGISEIDLLAFRFGFSFSLRMNLGTFFGGVAGIWAAR